MESTPTDRERAAARVRREMANKEAIRRKTLPICERWELWQKDPAGDEVEDLYDLLFAFQDTVVDLKAALQNILELGRSKAHDNSKYDGYYDAAREALKR